MALLFTFSQSTQGRLDAAQVTLFINGVKAVVGNPISTGDIITITTIPGRRLASNANSFTFSSIGIRYFTLNSNKSLGTMDLTSETNSVTANAFSSEIDPTVFTATQLYFNRATAAKLTLTKNGAPASIGTVFGVGEYVTLEVKDQTLLVDGALTYMVLNGSTQKNFTVSADGKSATYLVDGVDNITNFTCASKEEVSPTPVVWTVSQSDITKLSDNNAYLYNGSVRATAGTKFINGDTVRVTPDRDSRQLTNTWLNSTNETGNYERLSLVQNSDKSEATYTLTSDRAVTSFIVTTEARPALYAISSDDMARYEAGQATLKINGAPASIGLTIGVGDSMVATANPGRVFYADSVYNRQRGGGRQVFTQNADSTIASLIVGVDGVSGLYVDTVLAPSPDVSGLNNVYELSETQLKLVTQKRWEINTAGDVVDYGKFFIGLISLPFTIDPNYIVGDQDVRLGPLDTDIPAKLLDRDVIRLNLGTIRVASEKGNLLDYKNTVAMLYLPYTDPVALDLEYVIDEEIAIEYAINLYDGVATVSIMSSKIDNIILSINVDMGISIPFANVDQTPSKNSPLSIKMGFDNGIKVPFIEIMRNEAILSDGFFTIPIVDEGLLSAANGYVLVEEIQLNCKATKREKELIISLLKSGVVL